MTDPVTTGGTALSTPEKEPLPILVAPTTEVAFNTIRAFLIPVGCWRVDDVRFAFDSSLVHPDVKTEMALLATLRAKHPGAPLSIFGHADPSGDDDYNKKLSGRRAVAIYALLTRDIDKWEKLQSSPLGNDNWDSKAIQMMADEVGSEPSAATGKAGRAKLFAAYMDAVCIDAAGKPYSLKKSDFLAKGANADGKGDFQGCGEFNPFLVFSKAETIHFQTDHETRNSENAPNRRVMALLFKPGTSINSAKWPCPTVKEGVGGCTKRFWSDGDTRRNPQDARRKFEDTKDTYGCRFYHRLFVLSPCGAAGSLLPPVVLEIKATIEASKEIRVGSKRSRPVRTLKASTSNSMSLTDNEPTILIQGCKDVDLEAVISAPTNVTWTIAPTENTNPAPAITPVAGTPNNTKAKLSSAQGGSFSVTASNGTSKVIWNVVFVSVKIALDKAPPVDLRKSGYSDGSFSKANPTSNVNFTIFKSGLFKPGEYAFEAFLPEIKLVGGGTDGKLGIAKIDLHYLQNGDGDSLTAHYEGGKTAREVVQDAGGNTVAFPVTDSVDDADESPFADDPRTFSIKTISDDTRSWRVGDSPGGSCPHFHKGKRAESITGTNEFHAAVASNSQDAPDTIVVHADTKWVAHYDGTISTGAVGTYTPNGADTTGDASMTLVAPATNGKDAADAGFELFEPRFNHGSKNVFDD